MRYTETTRPQNLIARLDMLRASGWDWCSVDSARPVGLRTALTAAVEADMCYTSEVSLWTASHGDGGDMVRDGRGEILLTIREAIFWLGSLAARK